MKVCFFGHKNSYNCNLYENKIKTLLISLIKSNKDIVFYCGGMSDFDSLCANIVRKLKPEYPNIKLIFITPYLRESYLRHIDKSRFDDILYPPIENTPQRFAIIKRNEWVIDNCDMALFYLLNTFGGAYNSYIYAKRKGKTTILINN